MKYGRVWAALLLFALPSLEAQQNSFPAPDGSHLLTGRIDLSRAEAVTGKLEAVPTWISGFGGSGFSTWYVLLDNGSVQKLVVEPDGSVELSDTGRTFPRDTMLSLDLAGPCPQLFDAEAYAGNYYSAPVTVLASGERAAVSRTGELIVGAGKNAQRLKMDFLYDSRIVQNDAGRLLLLTGNSSRYGHGILGDRIEATGYLTVATEPVPGIPRVVHRFTLADEGVFETLQPIWKDVDGDQTKEIILTRSDSGTGAGLRVYSEDGRLIATGKPLGQGFRWLHLLSAGPFGPEGETEIAVVRTPHIGGRLEYYRLENGRLIMVHAQHGYSTHRIGSRNLDTALAGDFNADGELELLLPRQNFKRLDSLRRTQDGVEIDFSLELGEGLSTNIAAYSMGGEIFLALGTYAGEVIVMWHGPDSLD